MNQKISYFRGRYGTVWYTLLSKPTCPFLPTLLVDFQCRCLSHPCHCLTYWGRESLSVQHASLSSQRVKCRYGWPLSIWPTKTPTMRSFMMGQHWGMSANMLNTAGSQEASIQHGSTRIKSMSWPLTCSARNLYRTGGTNEGGGNITCFTCPRIVEGI